MVCLSLSKLLEKMEYNIFLTKHTLKEYEQRAFWWAHSMILMWYVFWFSTWKHIVGTHLNYLNMFIKAYVEAIKMSTHNISYYKEIDNITWTAIWTYEIAWLCTYGVCAVIRSNVVIKTTIHSVLILVNKCFDYSFGYLFFFSFFISVKIHH